MELPAYHVAARRERAARHLGSARGALSKRAGTVILASSIVLWFLQSFGFVDGAFTMVEDNNSSLLASIGRVVAPVFAPLGFGSWKPAVATFTGLIAKENVVSTFGVLYGFAEVAENGDEIWSLVAADFTQLSAYSFMIFNLLCAPCFAAMGAIKREMNNAKWTLAAIGYMCVFAYAVSLITTSWACCSAPAYSGVGTVGSPCAAGGAASPAVPAERGTAPIIRRTAWCPYGSRRARTCEQFRRERGSGRQEAAPGGHERRTFFDPSFYCDQSSHCFDSAVDICGFRRRCGDGIRRRRRGGGCGCSGCSGCSGCGLRSGRARRSRAAGSHPENPITRQIPIFFFLFPMKKAPKRSARSGLLCKIRLIFHDSFNVLDRARDGGGEVFAALLGDKAVVLEAEADAPLLAVDRDVHAEHHVRLHDLGLHLVVGVPAHVVRAAVPDVAAHVLIAAAQAEGLELPKLNSRASRSTSAIFMPGRMVENMCWEVL